MALSKKRKCHFTWLKNFHLYVQIKTIQWSTAPFCNSSFSAEHQQTKMHKASLIIHAGLPSVNTFFKEVNLAKFYMCCDQMWHLLSTVGNYFGTVPRSNLHPCPLMLPIKLWTCKTAANGSKIHDGSKSVATKLLDFAELKGGTAEKFQAEVLVVIEIFYLEYKVTVFSADNTNSGGLNWLLVPNFIIWPAP